MTGPNPDAELDAALGVTGLPSAVVANDHRALASLLMPDDGPAYTAFTEQIAQAIADAEQRGAARVVAEHAAAGLARPSLRDELAGLEPRDGVLFLGDDEQVYLGCAECGYGDDSPGPRPWDRAVDDLEDVLRYWMAHREQAHPAGGAQ